MRAKTQQNGCWNVEIWTFAFKVHFKYSFYAAVMKVGVTNLKGLVFMLIQNLYAT